MFLSAIMRARKKHYKCVLLPLSLSLSLPFQIRNLFCRSSGWHKANCLWKYVSSQKFRVSYEQGIDDFAIVHIHVIQSISLRFFNLCVRCYLVLFFFWCCCCCVVDIARNEFRSISHVRIKWKVARHWLSLVREVDRSCTLKTQFLVDLNFHLIQWQLNWWIPSAMNFERQHQR